MKTRTLLISGLLCTLLAGYYYHFETEPHLQPTRVPMLFSFEERDILGIDMRGASLISLKKKGAFWWIDGPAFIPADQEEVARLTASLVSIPVLRKTRGEPGDFGLGKPSMEIVLRTVRGGQRLFIGSLSPTSTFCYASLGGGPDILLIPARTREVFRKGLFALTDKSLVHINPWDVSRVKIVKNGNILECVKDRNGVWRLTGSQVGKLNTEKMMELFRQLCRIRAVSYPEENRSVPANPNVKVEILSTRGAQGMRMWTEGDRVYAVSDYQKSKAEVVPSFMKVIPSKPDDLLDRSVVHVSPPHVTMIEFSGKPARIFLKKDGEWRDGGRKVEDPAGLNAFLQYLGKVEYEDEYLLLPPGVRRNTGFRLYEGQAAPAFDITLYSQYYVAVGKKIYRINEGDMNVLRDAIYTLLRPQE